MATGINKVIILGRVGADPDVKQTAGGLVITNLSIATSEQWLDKKTSEKKQATEWHHVTFFNKLAETVGNIVKKGSLVYVEGKLKTQSWDDKESGQKRSKISIQGDNIQFLDSKSVATQHPVTESRQQNYPANNNYANQQKSQLMPLAREANTFFNDDIPF